MADSTQDKWPILGLPRPKGWSIERVTAVMAGTMILFTLLLGRTKSSRWRLMTAFIGGNLILAGSTGWCPMSVLLHRAGVKTAAEQSRS